MWACSNTGRDFHMEKTVSHINLPISDNNIPEFKLNLLIMNNAFNAMHQILK